MWVVLVVVVVEVDCVGGCASPPWLVGERRKPSDGTPPSEEGAPPLAGGQDPITPQS